MKTTLNKIKEFKPCKESWVKLLDSLKKTKADDDPLELKHILETLGVQDSIWALRSLEGKDKEIRLFACDCAESVLHIFEEKYPNDKRPRKAIEVSRLYANGRATKGELAAAYDAAYASAYAAAANAAANASAYAAAANAAANAAYDAAAERIKQKELFIKYFCND